MNDCSVLKRNVLRYPVLGLQLQFWRVGCPMLASCSTGGYSCPTCNSSFLLQSGHLSIRLIGNSKRSIIVKCKCVWLLVAMCCGFVRQTYYKWGHQPVFFFFFFRGSTSFDWRLFCKFNKFCVTGSSSCRKKVQIMNRFLLVSRIFVVTSFKFPR